MAVDLIVVGGGVFTPLQLRNEGGVAGTSLKVRSLTVNRPKRAALAFAGARWLESQCPIGTPVVKRFGAGRVEQGNMKTLLFALATLAAGAGSAHAELFSPSVVPGAIIGGVAGAVIGNNSGSHRGGDGAVIGAIAGGVIGAAIDSDRYEGRYQTRGYDERYYSPAPVARCEPPVVYREAPRVVYVQPAPRVVYVQPRHEVIIRRDDRHHNDYRRYDHDSRGRSYDGYRR